jgi:hypothetical protein
MERKVVELSFCLVKHHSMTTKGGNISAPSTREKRSPAPTKYAAGRAKEKVYVLC